MSPYNMTNYYQTSKFSDPTNLWFSYNVLCYLIVYMKLYHRFDLLRLGTQHHHNFRKV